MINYTVVLQDYDCSTLEKKGIDSNQKQANTSKVQSCIVIYTHALYI